MKFDIEEAQLKASKVPHEIFLTNLIVNHILYFAFALSASSLPLLIAMVPIISILALGYLMIRGRKVVNSDSIPWFVQCHWRVAMKRGRLLLIMLGGLITLLGALFSIHLFGGTPFAQVIPFMAVITMPVMVTILALIIMESEGLHHARTGQLSKGIVEQYPAPTEVKLIEE